MIWSVDQRESGDMVSRPERERGDMVSRPERERERERERVVIWSVDRTEW